MFNAFPHTTILQQTIFFVKNYKISIIEWITYDFFCHYVFKNPSAAEASESVYMRESVNSFGANVDIFANKRDAGESAHNELSHLLSALFAI